MKIGSSRKSFAINFLNDPLKVTEFPSLASLVDKVTGMALNDDSFPFTDSTLFFCLLGVAHPTRCYVRWWKRKSRLRLGCVYCLTVGRKHAHIRNMAEGQQGRSWASTGEESLESVDSHALAAEKWRKQKWDPDRAGGGGRRTGKKAGWKMMAFSSRDVMCSDDSP